MIYKSFFLNNYFFLIFINNNLIKEVCIDYRITMGIGDWGLGPIPNPQSPIPNPQSPIPNPQLIKRNI